MGFKLPLGAIGAFARGAAVRAAAAGCFLPHFFARVSAGITMCVGAGKWGLLDEVSTKPGLPLGKSINAIDSRSRGPNTQGV